MRRAIPVSQRGNGAVADDTSTRRGKIETYFYPECLASQVNANTFYIFSMFVSSLFPTLLPCSFFQLSQGLFYFLSPIPVVSLITVSLET